MIRQALAELRRMARSQLRPNSPEPASADAGLDDDEARLAAVGATAITVALCRAAESEREQPWFSDPLARHVAETAEPARETIPRPGLVFWVAVRTRFLDELLLDAIRDGVRQVVLLGAGLDARAIRLEFPDDVTCYEVDRSSVHELKTRLLKQARLTARCERRVVVADLASSDWLVALRTQGWVSDQPTCWIAEGLLIYLKPEPRDALLRQLAAVSAPGSRLGVTATSSTRAAEVRIWESGIAGDAARWLESLGWATNVSTLPETAAAFGRPVGVETQRARSATLIDARPIQRTTEGSAG